MSEKILFSYFYGQEADKLSFYRIPKLLFTSDTFRELSTDGKVLYGLMLDRMSISIKNKWFDEENRAYIYFSVEDTMEMLNCKKNKAIDTLKAVEGFGLIERKRQGQGKPTIIYVKSFMEEITEQVQKLEKQTSDVENGSSEVGKTNPNNNKYNNTEFNDTNLIRFDEAETDDYQIYAELIRENIELDCLLERYPFDVEILEGIFDLILETVLSTSGSIHIAKNNFPIQLVKSKFLKLNSSHIEYVMESLKGTTSKVRNIKKYLLAALFNAPSTIGSYYQAEVNHDMPQFAWAK